jgi:sphingolipid delta-4 desaturase
VFEGTCETYSYYGPLNALAYNVGYHNEHHDFPSVPWSRLPLVTQIAPEFYSDLPQCYSWPGTVLRYIFDDAISPFSRVKKRRDKED